MPGYPDWQATAQWRGDSLVSVVNTPIAVGGTVLLASTATTNYAYLMLAGGTNFAANVSLDVTQLDPGASGQSFSQSFYFTQGSAAFLVPIMLPTVSVSARARSANATWSGYIAATNVPRTGWVSEGQAALLFATTAAIAAAGTAVVTIPPYVGPGKLMIDASQTNFTTRIRQYGLDGTTQLGRPFTDAETVKAVATYDVWLPSGINELRIGNNAGTATTYTYSLTPVSYWGVDG